MKKLCALLMVLVMVTGLVACAPETQDETPKVSITIPDNVLNSKEQVNADVYPLDTDTVLRVLFTEDGMGDIDASALWERVTGVKVDNLTWNNEQMMLSLSSEDIPDAIVMPWDFPKEKVYEYGVSGQFLDFSQHLDKMPNLCALIKEYPEILEVCAYPNGAMYSLPKVGWSNTTQSNLLYIRTDLLEDMGWDKAPATADEFLRFIKEAQDKYSSDPEFIAFMPQNNTYMSWNSTNSIASTLFPAFGELVETGFTVNAEGEVVLGAATEQYRYYLEFMHEVWESGAFETEIYTLDSTAGKAAIQNGHCAVSIGYNTPATYFSDGIAHVEVMAPLTSQYQGNKQWMKTPLVSYRGCVANANCKDLDTLLAWLDSFYATEENPLNKEGTVYGYSLSKGELGVNWTKDEEAKTYTTIGTFKNYYDALYSGEFLYSPTTSLQIKGEGTIKNLLPYAVEKSALDIMVLSEDDQDTFADIWTDMEKYISQMHAKFITGQEDLDTGWDNYLNRLTKMGLEEVLDIYQGTYDAT